ncbi:hypothetical protein AVEN_59243-1 [Araneus ventricosus]|uniref:Uncharacterized protein n=1 Tax=Araneus ventricosus TaxID=182803 RepID=A0A4Y2CZW4_ARAVE|nr:hypothetical protein AVEN_59243-1 [Araneus ventricosus]
MNTKRRVGYVVEWQGLSFETDRSELESRSHQKSSVYVSQFYVESVGTNSPIAGVVWKFVEGVQRQVPPLLFDYCSNRESRPKIVLV